MAGLGHPEKRNHNEGVHLANKFWALKRGLRYGPSSGGKVSHQRNVGWKRKVSWTFLVAAGSLLTVMSFPGQTAGLSPLTDPLIESLQIDRTTISISYLVATLSGALTMPLLGKALDKYGTRLAIIITGFALSGFLYLASHVSDILGLTISYIGLRMFGQGALTLAATTLIARTVTHRTGLALGIVGAVGSAGISLAPIAIERIISLFDVATAWRIESALVVLVVLPIAFLLPKESVINAQSTLEEPNKKMPVLGDYKTSQALKTGMFWILSCAGFATGMLSTGLAFHLISILGSQGLSSIEAAANFIPQAFAAVGATLIVGAIIDRVDPRWATAGSMLVLCACLILLSFVRPGISALLFGALLGGTMGSLRGIEAAAFVRYFGRSNIGAIRGLYTSIALTSTAVGPVYFAVGLSIFGSYAQASLAAVIFPLAVAFAALIVKPPGSRQVNRANG